jgi:hypothetical protein
LNVFAESFESDGLSVESTNGVDDFPELFFIESVLELSVDVLKLFNGELSSSFKVVQTEVSSSALFGEWASLDSI